QLDYIMTPGNNVSDVHYYLPIPSGEIMLNPELKQNEGW
ncbi:RagB/SusD family nutrient uptake outer membrane protein, partial [Bacteroides cellulosilyticus]